MPRKSSRTAEEKYQIVLEGLRTGNIAETCRQHAIATADPEPIEDLNPLADPRAWLPQQKKEAAS